MQFWHCAFLLLALGQWACANDSARPAKTAQGGDPSRGRGIYIANCIACHNTDPSRDGPIGPAITGSSRELIEARVLRGEYPPGYTPKRPTRVMPTMPYLKSAIPHLVAYLDEKGTRGAG